MIGTFGDSAVSGKPVVDDLRDGKSPVLVAWARELASESDRATLDALHGNPNLDDEGAETMRAIIRECGALATVEEIIDVRAASSLGVVESAPIAAETRALLAEIAGAAVRRARSGAHR